MLPAPTMVTILTGGSGCFSVTAVPCSKTAGILVSVGLIVFLARKDWETWKWSGIRWWWADDRPGMEGMNRRLGWRPVFKWKRGVVSRDMVRDGGWGCGPLSVWRGLYVLWNINRQKKIMLLKKETIQQYKKWFHLGLECLNLSFIFEFPYWF